MEEEKKLLNELENLKRTNSRLRTDFEQKIRHLESKLNMLQGENEQYSQLFSRSLDGIFFMMLDTPIVWNDTVNKEEVLDYVFEHQKIVLANKALITQYRTTAEKIIGLTPADLNADDIEYGRSAWRDFFDRGQLHISKETSRFDGSKMFIEGNYLCLYDEQKRITGHFGIQRDFTMQKSAEEKLKMFEQAFSGYTEGINIASLEDKVLYANPAFCRMYGYTPEELIGKTSEFFRSEKNPPVLLEKIQTAAMSGGWKGELLNKRKDGSEFPIYLTTSEIYNEKKEKIAFLGIAEDITERKREEAERQALFEIIHGITTTSNLDELLKLIHTSLGKVIYAENCFVALYNENTGLFNFPYYVDQYDPAPSPLSLEKSCTAYVFKTGRPLLLTSDRFAELLEQKEVELVGTNSPSWIGIPLNIPERTIGVLVLQNYEDEKIYTDKDISFLDSIGSQIALAIDRKMTEEKLDESEEVFRRLFDESNDPILLLDESGFTDCNPATVTLLGYTSKEEFLNKEPWKLSPKYQPDGRTSEEKAKQMIELAIQNGYNKFEWLHTKSNGSDIPVEVMLTPIQVKGKQYLYTVWRDITERFRAESEIKLMNEQLKELIASRDKFFAIIAHDLKSPFQGLLGLTQIISENPENFSLKELSEIATGLHGTASNLFALLKNLLEWAQVQRGSISFCPVEFPLHEIVKTNIAVLQKRAKQKQIVLRNKTFKPVSVYADKNMINSVVLNLISNSVKFTEAGGTVSVGIKRNKDKSVTVSVQDTGIGMNSETTARLFKSGEKVKRKGTDGEPSTGLGLILCKEFIELNGGTIRVESEEGKGSTFYFALPLKG